MGEEPLELLRVPGEDEHELAARPVQARRVGQDQVEDPAAAAVRFRVELIRLGKRSRTQTPRRPGSRVRVSTPGSGWPVLNAAPSGGARASSTNTTPPPASLHRSRMPCRPEPGLPPPCPGCPGPAAASSPPLVSSYAAPSGSAPSCARNEAYRRARDVFPVPGFPSNLALRFVKGAAEPCSRAICALRRSGGGGRRRPGPSRTTPAGERAGEGGGRELRGELNDPKRWLRTFGTSRRKRASPPRARPSP